MIVQHHLTCSCSWMGENLTKFILFRIRHLDASCCYQERPDNSTNYLEVHTEKKHPKKTWQIVNKAKTEWEQRGKADQCLINIWIEMYMNQWNVLLAFKDKINNLIHVTYQKKYLQNSALTNRFFSVHRVFLVAITTTQWLITDALPGTDCQSDCWITFSLSHTLIFPTHSPSLL